MIDEPDDALDWLNYTVMRQDLLFDHKILIEELFIPINLTNSHLILIQLDPKNNTFFPINPYDPQNPSIDEIQTTGEITLKHPLDYLYNIHWIPEIVEFLCLSYTPSAHFQKHFFGIFYMRILINSDS